MTLHACESSDGSTIIAVITWVSLGLAILAISQNVYIYRRSRRWATQSETSASQAAESLSIIDGTAHELSTSVAGLQATLAAAQEVILDLRGDVKLLVELADAASPQLPRPDAPASLEVGPADIAEEIRQIVQLAETGAHPATVLDVVGGRGQVWPRLNALKKEINEGRILVDGPLRSASVLRIGSR